MSDGNLILRPALTLWQREVVRFFRQKNRVVGALATPIVFWLLLGGGMGSSFRAANAPAGLSYLEYFFPGTLLLIILFTSIFSTISIIEDRREGFLQSVLVAPVGREAIVLGKVLGGTSIAAAQGLLFYLLAPFAGIPLSWSAVLPLLGVLLLVGFGLTALGFLIAWPLDSTQGFHAIMNLFLMPMWMVSGALFPATGATPVLRHIMTLNPVYYALEALRHVLYPDQTTAAPGQPSLLFCLGILTAFAAMLFVACRILAEKRKGPVMA